MDRMGHDQLFKQVLQAFFPDFLRLFDPETAAGLDLRTVSFRDTEAFTDIPQGERRTADLVAQVQTVDGTPELVLVHVEVQREREVQFSHRMWQYYTMLRHRENLPVIPIALVLYPGREGIGLEEYTEAVLGRTYLSFRYVPISLPLLPAEEFVQAESALGAGLASVMRLPQDRAAQIALHLACLRRVRAALEADDLDEARAFLLINLVATYLPLNDEERRDLQVQLQQEGDTIMEATELTWADQWFLRGRQEGEREAIRRLLRARFGRVAPELETTLVSMTREDELDSFVERICAAQTEADLLG